MKRFTSQVSSCQISDPIRKTITESEPKTKESIDSDIQKFLEDFNNGKNEFLNDDEVKQVRKKTSNEVNFLEKMFTKDPTWNRNTVQICKKALKLKTDQVYKWGYDKKLLLRKKTKTNADPLNNKEISNQMKREIFLEDDLSEYVRDLVNWFESAQSLPTLNEVSSQVRINSKITAKSTVLTKNLTVNSFSIKVNQEEGNHISDLSSCDTIEETPMRPFAPLHSSSRSLFETPVMCLPSLKTNFSKEEILENFEEDVEIHHFSPNCDLIFSENYNFNLDKFSLSIF